MIQRIQTLFLLAITIFMIISLFVPMWNSTNLNTGEKRELTAFSLKSYQVSETGQEIETGTKSSIYIALLAIAAAAVSGFSITRYQNRLTQMKLGALNSLLMAGVLLSALYLTYSSEQEIEQQGNYLLGFFLPGAGLVCNILANRFIRRDEMLVRSVDRLR
jgi:ABC-type spermidine/putrescine transport system permease subunit II